MSNKIYRPVNWVNGMNINQSHFVKEQMSNLSMQMSALQTCLSPFNYGFIVEEGKGEQYIWIDINNNLGINVELANVKILFSNGYLLEFLERDENFGVFYSVLPEDNSQDYAIVLRVNVNDRITFGNPDAEEEPIRKPYVIPKITLSLISVNEVNSSFFDVNSVVVGRLITNYETWVVDSDYIPPVHNIYNNSNLIRVHHNFENYLSSIERSTVEIIQKIRQKKQNNELASILMDISVKLNTLLVEEIIEFKTIGIYRTPVKMLTPFFKMARLMNNVLDTWQSCGKDEMMTYLSDWCNISQGELEKVILSLIHHKYNHNDINSSVKEVTYFADVISAMYTVLASLDYIGKKIDTNLFVAEEQEENIPNSVTSKKKRKFSLLGSY